MSSLKKLSKSFFVAVALLLLSAVPLFSIDRLLLDDWTTLDVRIINQNAESVTYVQEDGKTNVVSKAEIRGIQLNVAEDKFYSAALEESDPDRQILLLKKSTERYPKDRANINLLVRVYLKEMQLENAAKYLTNASLAHPGFDLLKVLWTLKAADGRKADALIPGLNRKGWGPAQRMQEGLLQSLCKADQKMYKEAIFDLNQLEKKYYPGPVSTAFSNLTGYYSYDHYRKTLHSLVYLWEKRHKTRAQLEAMTPNVTRYYRRGTTNTKVEWVESLVLTEPRASENLEVGNVITGALLTGFAGSAAFFSATYFSDYLSMKSVYDSTLDASLLRSTSTSDTGFNNNNNNNNELSSDPGSLDKVFAALGSSSTTPYKLAYANSILSGDFLVLTGLTGGLGAFLLLNAGNSKALSKINHKRPLTHLTFKDDPNRMSLWRFASGYSSLALLAAVPLFAANADLWWNLERSRKSNYSDSKSGAQDTLDLLYMLADQANFRARFYTGMAIGLGLGGLITGALFILNPFPKTTKSTGLVLPTITPDGFAFNYINYL